MFVFAEILALSIFEMSFCRRLDLAQFAASDRRVRVFAKRSGHYHVVGEACLLTSRFAVSARLNHWLGTPDDERQTIELVHHFVGLENGVAGPERFRLGNKRNVFPFQCCSHCRFCLWRNDDQRRSRLAEALTNIFEDVNDRPFAIDQRNDLGTSRPLAEARVPFPPQQSPARSLGDGRRQCIE